MQIEKRFAYLKYGLNRGCLPDVRIEQRLTTGSADLAIFHTGSEDCVRFPTGSAHGAEVAYRKYRLHIGFLPKMRIEQRLPNEV